MNQSFLEDIINGLEANKEIAKFRIRLRFEEMIEENKETVKLKALSPIEESKPVLEQESKQEEPEINWTKEWLLDPKFDRYEKLQDIIFKNLRSSTKIKVPYDEHLDFSKNFMVWLIDTDHFSSTLKQGKKINSGAVWFHFTQWVVRYHHKEGKDALSREKLGARTQAQIMKRKNGEEQVFQSAKIAVQVKDEDGNVLDMYDDDQEDPTIDIRTYEIKNKVHSILRTKFPDESEFYIQLFNDKYDEKYSSVVEWAKAINIPERNLRNHLSKMVSKLQSMGKDAFF